MDPGSDGPADPGSDDPANPRIQDYSSVSFFTTAVCFVDLSLQSV